MTPRTPATLGRLELIDLVVHGTPVSVTAGPGRLVVLHGPGGLGVGGGMRVDGIDARRRSASFGLLSGCSAPAGRLRDLLGSDRSAVDRALGGADLRHWLDQLPDGLDTLVGPGGRSLSPQQRIQLEVARLLVDDPAAVLIDGPTAGLGPVAAEAVLRPLRRLMVGRACVVITTDLRFRDTADTVLELVGDTWHPVVRVLPGAAGRYAMARAAA